MGNEHIISSEIPSSEDIKNILQNKNYKLAIEKLTANIEFNAKESIERNGPVYGGLYNEGLYRYQWIDLYKSWALPPTVEQLQHISNIFKDLKILEIGAGKGLWAALLRSVGSDIIATDPSENTAPVMTFDTVTSNDSPQNIHSTYTDIERLNCSEALIKYGNISDCLFVCWGVGYPTSEEFSHFKGNYVMTIGEEGEEYGCTSTGCLETLGDNPDWDLLERINIPQWYGLYDTLAIYQRKI